MTQQLVISIITDDRPGVVEKIAAEVSRHKGNWLESSLTRLGGKFAGIILVSIDSAHQASLESGLHALAAEDIRIAIDVAGQASAPLGDVVSFDVVGNDRLGIVGEISQLLANHHVSVDGLYTRTENAPMSGEMLFISEATVVMPSGMATEDLQYLLEQLSDDLMVEFS